ncbi:MAG: Gfo/Idh/MocA family protein [Acidobacteriota bacterium]
MSGTTSHDQRECKAKEWRESRANEAHEPEAMDRRELMKLGVAGVGAAMVAPEALAGYANAARVEPGSASADMASGSTGPVSVSSGHIQLPAPALGLAPEHFFADAPIDLVRVGFVGVGLQGSAHCRNLLQIDGVELAAVCDIVPEKVERMQQRVVDAGFPKPAGYSRGELDFVRMCEQEDLDLVYTATPWRWHVPVCVAAMENGKHAATEVPAAYRIDDCWKLVENAENHGRHCVMMENCNHDRPEMMVFNMVRQGLFGEIVHGACGYLHDLREIKFEDRNEGLWRREHAKHRNGNLYPTHGLGPIANCMDNNRGDRFEYLVSMSSPSRGLELWAEAHYPEGDPKRQEKYVLGDVNTALIKTARGRTIYINHDTNLPRPYSRIHKVQGTKGLFHGYPNRVYIEGYGRPHRWIDEQGYDWQGEHWDIERVFAEYEHPIWKELREMSAGAGHGGMDFIEDYRLFKCLHDGTPTDMNVYDAVAISAVCELTEISVANDSAPVEFPDFTRGRWKSWPQLGIVHA